MLLREYLLRNDWREYCFMKKHELNGQQRIYEKAMIIGMMIRLDTQNSTEKLFKKHFARSIMELKSIDYTEQFITNALSNLHKRPAWRNRLLWMKNIIPTIFKPRRDQEFTVI